MTRIDVPELDLRSPGGRYRLRSVEVSLAEEDDDYGFHPPRRLELLDTRQGVLVWRRLHDRDLPAPIDGDVDDHGDVVLRLHSQIESVLALLGRGGDARVLVDISRREGWGEDDDAHRYWWGSRERVHKTTAGYLWSHWSHREFLGAPEDRVFVLRLAWGERLILGARDRTFAVHRVRESIPAPLRASLRARDLGFAETALARAAMLVARGGDDGIDYEDTIAALAIAVEYGHVEVAPHLRALERPDRFQGYASTLLHTGVHWCPNWLRRVARAALLALGEAPGAGPIARLEQGYESDPIPTGPRPSRFAELRERVRIGMDLRELVAEIGIPDDYGRDDERYQLWRYDERAADEPTLRVLEVEWSAYHLRDPEPWSKVQAVTVTQRDRRALGRARLLRLLTP